MHRVLKRSQGTMNPPANGSKRAQRVQQLIDALRQQCSTWLHAPLERGLTHFGSRLLALANGAINHLDQHAYLDTHQRLKLMRDEFDRSFIDEIECCFDELGTRKEAQKDTESLSLNLLDTTAHERDAALDQLVTRCMARGAIQMVNLGYRFGVLLGTPPLDSAQLPVGPQAMARAFRKACSLLKIPTQHELLLLKSLESSLIDNLTSLHEQIDGYLSDADILPGLKPYALPRPKRRQESRAPGHAATRSGAHRKSSSRRSYRPAAFNATREPGVPSDGAAASGQQLQAALFSIQEHLLKADDHVLIELNQPQRLREEMSLLLNVGHPGSDHRYELSRAQSRTVDRVAKLFGNIVQKLPQHVDTRALLLRLQIPVLRIALLDPTFFAQTDHPARLVLDKLADITRDWIDDASGVPDRDLQVALDRLIDNTCRSRPSATVFAGMLDAIDQSLSHWKEGRQAVEEQQEDARRGLERLEKARLRTSELLAEHDASSGHAMRHAGPLHHAWSDVLALTMLRHGEDSAVFGKRLRISDRLLGLQPVRDMRALHLDLVDGLRQIGMREDEQARLIEAWMNGLRKAKQGVAIEDSGSSANGDGTHAGDTGASASTASTQSPDILRMHRYLRDLPAGRWFEFLGPNGAPPIRRRLVWYSPLSGQSLFVTRNGLRAQELGELKLARAITSGHIREVAEQHKEAVDDASPFAMQGPRIMPGTTQHEVAS